MVTKRAEPAQVVSRAGRLRTATAEVDQRTVALSKPENQLDLGVAGDAGLVGEWDSVPDGQPRKSIVTSLPRSSTVPHIAIVASDVIAIGLALGLASLLIPHASAASAGARLGADVALMLPMLVVVLLAFALNGLYRRWSYQVLSSSFTELRAIVFSLGLAGSVTLGIDHLLTRFAVSASVGS